MKNTVNIALQILPTSTTVHPYTIVDAAIKVIADSGLKYLVTPFETVMEGDYAKIIQVIEDAQLACYATGAESLMTYVKIQSNGIKDVAIEDKIGKYI